MKSCIREQDAWSHQMAQLGESDANLAGCRGAMESLRESLARMHEGGQPRAASSTAVDSVTPMLSLLRHSATVCTALGRASAHVVQQLLEERQHSSANANPTPTALEAEMLQILEKCLMEADPEAQVVHSLFAAPMLSAFMHAFHTETFVLRTAAAHSEAASTSLQEPPEAPAAAAPVAEGLHVLAVAAEAPEVPGAAAAAAAGGESLPVLAAAGQAPEIRGAAAASATPAASATSLAAGAEALHVLAVAAEALPGGTEGNLSLLDGGGPAMGLLHSRDPHGDAHEDGAGGEENMQGPQGDCSAHDARDDRTGAEDREQGPQGACSSFKAHKELAAEEEHKQVPGSTHDALEDRAADREQKHGLQEDCSAQEKGNWSSGVPPLANLGSAWRAAGGRDQPASSCKPDPAAPPDDVASRNGSEDSETDGLQFSSDLDSRLHRGAGESPMRLDVPNGGGKQEAAQQNGEVMGNGSEGLSTRQDLLKGEGPHEAAEQRRIGGVVPNILRHRKKGKQGTEREGTSAPSRGAWEAGSAKHAPSSQPRHRSPSSPMVSQQDGSEQHQGRGKHWLRHCNGGVGGMPDKVSTEGPSKGPSALGRSPARASPGLAEGQRRDAAGEASAEHHDDSHSWDEASPSPHAGDNCSTMPTQASSWGASDHASDHASAGQLGDDGHRGKGEGFQRTRTGSREQEAHSWIEEQGEIRGRAGPSGGQDAEAEGEGAEGRHDASGEVLEHVSSLHSLLASANPVAATALAPLLEMEALCPSTTHGARLPADVAGGGEADVSRTGEKEPPGSQVRPADRGPSARRRVHARSMPAVHPTVGIADEGGMRTSHGGAPRVDRGVLDNAGGPGASISVTELLGLSSRSSSQLATMGRLPLALRAVEAMEQQNHLTAESLKQAQLANALQVEQLRVSMESNSLLRTELVLTREKAEARAAQVVEVRAEKEQEQFLRCLADELLFGLLLMVLALVLVGWKQASLRLEADALHCIRLKQDSLATSWLQWYRFDKAMMKGLRFLGCKLTVTMQLLSAIAIVGVVCYVMLVSNVLGAQATRPASVILFALAGICGFCGFHAVRYAGGNPYVWFVLWETLCGLHGVSTFYSPVLCLLLNGRALGEREGPAAKPRLQGAEARNADLSRLDQPQHLRAQQLSPAAASDCAGSESQGGEAGAMITSGEAQEGQAHKPTWGGLSKWMRKVEKMARDSTIPPWLRQLCFHVGLAVVLPLLAALLPFISVSSGEGWGAPGGTAAFQATGSGSLADSIPRSFPDDSF